MPLVQGTDYLGRPVFDPEAVADTNKQKTPITAQAATAKFNALKFTTPKTYEDNVDQSTFLDRNDSIRGRSVAADNLAQQQAQEAREARVRAAQAAAQKAISAAQDRYGASSDGTTSSGMDFGLSTTRQAILKNAAAQRGVAYRWGGTSSKTGFDCSGLVKYAYSRAGIQMPRTSGQQAHMGVRTSISRLLPGDLVAHPGHIAIYAGNGMMWEAPHAGASVRLVPVRSDMYGVHITVAGE